ncbi:hypothetical protein QAD02_002285 [Eretmocerus hayati]|uniref:Uncharacterized protein n=1 Tax=Eretmocerus hayati TaxID=131215 RepID=A0ACC2NJE6_9HYME|nr:hypothetical protein QAD02_002285 [Eretmocerus hayati]
MYGMDGKFNANDVIKYNHHLARLLGEEGISVEYISADGDPKLLRAHRIISGLSSEQYSEIPRTYTTNDETIVLPEYHAYIKENLIPTQDQVHVVTKLRNNLIKDSCVLPMGTRMASSSDLEDLIQVHSKDKHKLTRPDLKPNDKMHFKSVLRVCNKLTIDQLKKYVKRREATQMYLTCMNCIARSSLCKNLNIRERVYCMWYPLYFFRLWREWIMQHPVHNLTHNAITNNTYVCIELNGHCIIQMVLLAIERNDFKTFYPWLIGSQSCESFFKVFRCDSTVQSLIMNCTVLEGTKKIEKNSTDARHISARFQKRQN